MLLQSNTDFRYINGKHSFQFVITLTLIFHFVGLSDPNMHHRLREWKTWSPELEASVKPSSQGAAQGQGENNPSGTSGMYWITCRWI